MRNRLIAGFLLASMLLAGIATVRAAGFTDLDGHWAKDYIEDAVSRGLFRGIDETVFSPDTTMTRAMFVTVLGRFAKIDVSSRNSATLSFSDVPDDAYYTPYVRWAVSVGIVNGMSADTFAPDLPITREQMAKMVAGFAAATGVQFHSVSESGTSFSDQAEISEWATDSVRTLQSTGILNGVAGDDGSVHFLPQKTATRAECAAVFCRLHDAIVTDVDDSLVPTESGEPNAPSESTEPEPPTEPDATTEETPTVSIELTEPTESTEPLEPTEPTEPTEPDDIADAAESYSDKCQRVFGTIPSDPRLYYDSADTAAADMTKIEIPVWNLAPDGSKIAATMTLTVHKNLAATVSAIFREIFDGEEQFPIRSVFGYVWSGKSEHSIGCAIDINPNENYYCYPDGTAIVGNYWKPYEDPYSIPPDGDVVTAFANHGFTQGIYWNSGYKDYMHFSYFGT